MSVFIVMHPADETKANRFDSLKSASEWAIRSNRASADHWSYLLYELTASDVRYRGRLWRAFGEDFDVQDCWRA